MPTQSYVISITAPYLRRVACRLKGTRRIAAETYRQPAARRRTHRSQESLDGSCSGFKYAYRMPIYSLYLKGVVR